MDDDVSNNSSWYGIPPEPLDQTIDRKKERAAALETINELQQVIKHFDERIAYRDSIESIKINLTEDPLLHQKKCETNEMVKIALTEERDLVQELIDMYAPK